MEHIEMKAHSPPQMEIASLCSSFDTLGVGLDNGTRVAVATMPTATVFGDGAFLRDPSDDTFQSDWADVQGMLPGEWFMTCSSFTSNIVHVDIRHASLLHNDYVKGCERKAVWRRREEGIVIDTGVLCICRASHYRNDHIVEPLHTYKSYYAEKEGDQWMLTVFQMIDGYQAGRGHLPSCAPIPGGWAIETSAMMISHIDIATRPLDEQVVGLHIEFPFDYAQ